jgi:hypothetical protein
MTRKIRDRHARRLAGKTPKEVISFYRAAGEAAKCGRRRTKPRKGRAAVHVWQM